MIDKTFGILLQNLIHVRPYHFFGLTGDINQPPGSSRNKLNDIKLNDISEKEDQESYLLYLQNTLRSIHHVYYETHDEMVRKEVEESKREVPDTKAIVPSVRRQVLQGVSFSAGLSRSTPRKTGVVRIEWPAALGRSLRRKFTNLLLMLSQPDSIRIGIG